MIIFPCPFVGGDVELSDDRERHIAENHPELLPAHMDKVRDTLLDPDQIRRSTRFANARLFSKWYNDLLEGKNIVVVVVSDAEPRQRNWIVTAYVTRSISQGDVEWKRN